MEFENAEQALRDAGDVAHEDAAADGLAEPRGGEEDRIEHDGHHVFQARLLGLMFPVFKICRSLSKCL